MRLKHQEAPLGHQRVSRFLLPVAHYLAIRKDTHYGIRKATTRYDWLQVLLECLVLLFVYIEGVLTPHGHDDWFPAHNQLYREKEHNPKLRLPKQKAGIVEK